MTGRLRAGTARADITPPLTIPYLGYLPRQARFLGVHDPLMARALFLEDGDTRAAILTIDMIGIHPGLPGGDVRANVLRRLAGDLGLSAESLLVCASHCHSAPDTVGITSLHEVSGAREWLLDLAGRLAACVAEAADSAQAAELRLGRGEISTISANRRVLDKQGVLHKPPIRIPPEEWARPAPIDPEVPVARIDFADGTHSVLFGFTCHPTTVQVQPLVSADYPGVATALVEESAGCRECLFIQGACGDVNAIGGSASADFGAVRENGTRLGEEVLRVLASLAGAPASDASPIASETREVEFPRRQLPGRSPLREQLLAALAKALPPEDADQGGGGAFEARLSRQALLDARVMVEQLAEVARGPHPVRSTMHSMRIGDLAIAGIPGELLVRPGMEIKRNSPAALTICACYADDWIGYLSNPEAFAEGGYETSLGPWCPVGPKGGVMAVEIASQMLQRLWA